jgi:hypothetical protein
MRNALRRKALFVRTHAEMAGAKKLRRRWSPRSDLSVREG